MCLIGFALKLMFDWSLPQPSPSRNFVSYKFCAKGLNVCKQYIGSVILFFMWYVYWWKIHNYLVFFSKFWVHLPRLRVKFALIQVSGWKYAPLQNFKRVLSKGLKLWVLKFPLDWNIFELFDCLECTVCFVCLDSNMLCPSELAVKHWGDLCFKKK